MPLISAPSSVQTPPVFSRRQRMTIPAMLGKLEQIHRALKVGDGFPSRRELAEQFEVSERVVRDALEEFERQGKIIRRVGRGGSIVAEPSHATLLNGNALYSAPGIPTLSQVASDNRTVIAITEPDGNIFDQGMQLLMKQAKSANLAVACHLLSRSETAHFAVPPVAEGVRHYLVIRRENLPLAERLHEAGHRVVLVGTPFTDTTPGVPVVSGDQEHGGYLAMKHLLELGHRRIAFHLLNDIGFDFARDYVKVPRWVGAMHAVEEARTEGLNIQIRFLAAEYGGEFHGQVIEWGRNPNKVRDYFSRPEAPTAIASWNDDMAIRLLTQLQRAGIRVPEDVSLIGYDNLARSASMHPSLTTMDGVLDQQIRAALRLLTQPQAPAKSHSTVVLPTLVQRESTVPPRNV